jgi:hypothetical protein
MIQVVECHWTVWLILAFLPLALAAAEAGGPPVNYDESKIPPYTLPDPLVMANGERVTSAEIDRKSVV